MSYSVISYLLNLTTKPGRGAVKVKFVHILQVASTALSSVQPGLIPQPRRCLVKEQNGEQLQNEHYGCDGLEQLAFFPPKSTLTLFL